MSFGGDKAIIIIIKTIMGIFIHIREACVRQDQIYTTMAQRKSQSKNFSREDAVSVISST